MFYIPHSVGLIIGVCPKAGSTSLRNDLHVPGTRPLSITAVQELKKSFWRVVGVVRDPIDRFESCWNFFQYKHNGDFPAGQFKSIEDFTDQVLDGLENPHWLPQAQQLTECQSFVNLETFPLINHENKNEHIERASFRLDELRAYYKEDFNLRGGVWVS